ncbi:MAG: hypothetical protein IKT99_06380 [Oscillospiraceae bacterium]|nr:hypothetical protein [Oscillospiraceae bacterium]
MKLESLFTRVMTEYTVLPVPEAMDLVLEAITDDRNWRYTPVQAAENELSFSVRSRRVSRFTTFCPEVTVRFNATEEGTSVRTVCRSREQIRIMLPLVTVIFALLEIYNLILAKNVSQPGAAIILLPILWIVLLGLLTCLGLRLPAKEIQRMFQKALSRNI